MCVYMYVYVYELYYIYILCICVYMDTHHMVVGPILAGYNNQFAALFVVSSRTWSYHHSQHHCTFPISDIPYHVLVKCLLLLCELPFLLLNTLNYSVSSQRKRCSASISSNLFHSQSLISYTTNYFSWIVHISMNSIHGKICELPSENQTWRLEVHHLYGILHLWLLEGIPNCSRFS